MNIKFKELSFNEYEELTFQVLFHNEKMDRRFGVISDGILSYKFSWQSDTIDPVFIIIKDMICCLGVDQRFSIVDFSSQVVKVDVNLEYFLYDIRYLQEKVFVITELEIILIEISNYQIISMIPLPSFFSKMIVEKKQIVVECIDGEIITI